LNNLYGGDGDTWPFLRDWRNRWTPQKPNCRAMPHGRSEPEIKDGENSAKNGVTERLRCETIQKEVS